MHLEARDEDADVHEVKIGGLEECLLSLLAPPPGNPPPWAAWLPSTVTTRLAPRSPYPAFLNERQPRWTIGFPWLVFRDLAHRCKWRRPRVAVPDFLNGTAKDWAVAWDADPQLPEDVRKRIDAVLLHPFAWTDKLADYYANLTRSSIVLNYLMAAVAVVFALVGHALGALWIAAELVLIVIIVGNTLVGNHRRWHERWIDDRVLAERVRLQRFLAPLGRITPHTRRPAHLSFGDVRGSWLTWYFRALVRQIGMTGERYDPVYVEASRALMDKLLADEDSGQIIWHRSNAERFHRIEKHLERAGLLLFAATGLACAAHLFWHHAWLTMLSAGLPAFGAAFAAITVHLQLDRVAKHSQSMAAHLESLSAYIKRQPAVSRDLGPPLEQTAECMTSEVLDWRSLFRTTFRPPS
jgi:hypothetical protein